MTTGVCTNLPSQCSKAAAKEPIDMPTPDTTCPECGSRLQAASVRTPGTSIPMGLIIVIVALLALAIGGFFLFNALRGGGSETSTAPTAGGDPLPPVRPAREGEYLLRLAGSNTVGGRLAPDLVMAWLRAKGATDVQEQSRNAVEKLITARLDGRDVQVEVRAHGTDTAFTDLAAGTADIGMASRPAKDAEVQSLSSLGDLRSRASEHVLALDGLAIITPQSNAIPRLSREQVQGIFAGEITDWSEVGRASGGPIKLYARDDKSGTYDTFKSLVLSGRALAGAERFEDSAELEQAVSRDPDGIGFVGLSYVRNARAVAISDGSAAALEPTSFSVRTESYPLSRRLYFYTAAAPSNPNVRDFVEFALSAAGQRVVKAAKFVDLDLSATPSAPPPSADERGACLLSAEWSGDRQAYCKLVNGAEQVETSFRFLSGSAELDNRAYRDLRRMLERLEAEPGKTLVLAGFADSQGAYQANCALSLARARSVAAALGTLGVTSVETLGFCEELPVRDNATPEGRDQNRRVNAFLR